MKITQKIYVFGIFVFFNFISKNQVKKEPPKGLFFLTVLFFLTISIALSTIKEAASSVKVCMYIASLFIKSISSHPGKKRLWFPRIAGELTGDTLSPMFKFQAPCQAGRCIKAIESILI